MFDFVGDIFDGVGDVVGDLFGGATDTSGIENYLGLADSGSGGGFFSGLGGFITSNLGTLAKAGLGALMAPPQQSQQRQQANWAGVRNFGPESMSDARYAQGVKAPDPDAIAAYWYNKMRTYSTMGVQDAKK